MELEFRHALFASGAALILIGALSLAVSLAAVSQSSGALEAFSRGFDAMFTSLFAGVMLGIGIALLGNGILLQALGARRHVIIPSLLSLFFLSIATFSVMSRGPAPLLSLVAFFASITASAAFLLTALWNSFSDAAHRLILRK